MRTFVATILETRKRHLRLVAVSADQAMAMLQRTHGRDVKVERIAGLGATTVQGAVQALLTILHADYLDLDGTPATLREWLALGAAAEGSARRAFDEPLAMAGLRLRYGAEGGASGLIVGSARSIPFLADLMNGSGFEGEALHASLLLIPGATRTSVTLAGIPSRAVVLPWSAVAGASIMSGAA